MGAKHSVVPANTLPVEDQALLMRLMQCADLPSPVGVAMRILELSRDPEVSLSEVAKLIHFDPALTTKLLRMANSPLYARQRKTENLRQAINLFGLEGTITLALSFSVVNNLRESGLHGFDYQLFWRRSLAAAICAQILAGRFMLPNKEDAFLAGLLQDIGMLALVRVQPDLYAGLGSLQARHSEIQARERDVLGVDHAAIGAWLLWQWNFSENLQAVVGASHDPVSTGNRDKPEIDQQSRIVAVAADMAELWCNAGSQAFLSRLMKRAEELLGLSDEGWLETLETATVGMREIAYLFEVELDDSRYLDMIINQARELTVLRHIRVMQRSDVLARNAEVLETRTRKLEEETRRDMLTGLFNRAYLQQALTDEIETANRHGWPFAVIFIDLDNFKRINDEYGHLAGDQILRNTARILGETTRASDIIARYGGEEFIILLPGAGYEAARMSCDRLLSALREMRHRVNDKADLVVTASIGVAMHGEHIRYERPEHILKAADEALYKAKRQGRDRCIFYTDESNDAGAG